MNNYARGLSHNRGGTKAERAIERERESGES